MESAILGYQLDQFIELNPPIPPKFLTTEDELSGKLNSAFIDWHRQDWLLLSWLISSMIETVISQVVGCRTTSEVWHHILSQYANQTQAK